MCRRFAALLVALAAVASATDTLAQPPSTPTFRSDTRLIVQTVTVTDRQGNVIEGLEASDFSVKEDGRPQSIAFVEFQRIDQTPIAPTPPRSLSVEPPSSSASSASAIEPSRDFRSRRLLAFYFDASAMLPSDRFRAYAHALKYVDAQMARADMIAIITFQRGVMRVRQTFTDDRTLLREQISRLMNGDDPDGDGLPDDPNPGTAFGEDDTEFNIFNTNRQLAALQRAVTTLRSVRERKALIYFGTALRLNGTDNQAQFRATINAAIKANVAIHAIDAHGLSASPPLGDASRPSPGGIGMFTGELTRTAMTTTQRAQDTLYALARDTGGTVLLDYNDLSAGIVAAARSISSYYVIGYYTRHTQDDGKFHRVQVSLTAGRQGELSTRKGYYADTAFSRASGVEKESQLEQAFQLENPVTEIPVALEVDYFRLNSAEYFVPVALEIPGGALVLARHRGGARTSLDIMGEVKDDAGVTVQNVRDKLKVKLDGDTATRWATAPVQYQTGFTLLPGRYVLKMLVRDAETGRIGTYQTTFTIPNLDRQSTLPISSVVLGDQRVPAAEAIFSANGVKPHIHPLVLDGFKVIPTVTRVFSRARDMYVFLEVYGQATIRPVLAFVSVFSGGEKVMETAPLSVSATRSETTDAVPVAFSVSLATLTPGQYDCQITVLAPGGDNAAFWRGRIAVQ